MPPSTTLVVPISCRPASGPQSTAVAIEHIVEQHPLEPQSITLDQSVATS